MYLRGEVQSLGASKLLFSCCLFVLRFYGPVNPVGHVERGQFT